MRGEHAAPLALTRGWRSGFASAFIRMSNGAAAAALAWLFWTAALRLPFIANVGEDEAFFAIVAQRWLAGHPPYAASFDVKPPGLFAIVALAEAICGPSILTIKLLEIACVALSALGLYWIGARHVSRPVAIGAALLYPLYSLALAGANSAAELIEAPAEVFAALAVLEALRGGTRRFAFAAAAGALFGVAVMIRQHAVFTVAALLGTMIWQWRDKDKKARWRAASVAGGGLMLMPTVMTAIFIAHGQFRALIDGAVLGAAARMHGDNVTFIQGLQRFLPVMRPLVPLAAGPLLLLTRQARWRDGALQAPCIATLVWLAGSAAGIIAVRSMYHRYFLALEPSLLLASGIALCHLTGPPVGANAHLSPSGRKPLRLIAAVVTALVWLFAVDQTMWHTQTDVEASAAAAAAIERAGIPADATMLVPSLDMLTYLNARRLPDGRYFHPTHLLCDFPAPVDDPLASALDRHPGILVVADETRRIVCAQDDRYRELQAAITANYCLVARVSGKLDMIDIYADRQKYISACAR
jgi:4-amino-4-deoxy-L-arabinose transferase-like glycosyltransferase